MNLPNNPNEKIFVGQVTIEPYNRNRSLIVYEFLSLTKDFIIQPENGIIEYLPNRNYNQTKEEFQILARNLISQEKIIINITIYITKAKPIALIYHEKVSKSLLPGSKIFQPNISNDQHLQYSFEDYDPNLFTIDSQTGQVKLLNYLLDEFYLLKIHISPSNQILTLKLTIFDANNHSPIFFNLPLNLSISSDDTFVTKLSAHDLDNQNLQYYLLDKDQRNIFSINQTTGIILLENPSNQTYFQLQIGVSDGLYLTRNYLSLTIYNYSKTIPIFSSNEYVFEYKSHLGQITAYDPDPNDRLIYQLYLEPDGIQIDRYSGLITLHKNLSFPIIEFYASASDRAQQIAYTKIQILFPIRPKFTSNLYSIYLNHSISIPSEIFHFQLVDDFNQVLSSTRFEIDQTKFFQMKQNKLILKEQISQSKVFYLKIYGYWKNFTCQTSVQITFAEQRIRLMKKSYEFSLEKNHLKKHFLIKKFNIKNSLLKILSTPLTINNCTQNFYLLSNELYFNHSPIISNLCFFELQLSDQKMISTSQIKISFIDGDIKPKFTSNIYHFSSNPIRVFAQSSNTIRYRLQANPYGLIINPTTGILTLKYQNQIQLLVYAIDEKTNLNDTALIDIRFHQKKDFQIPKEIHPCSNTPRTISDQNLPGEKIFDKIIG